MSELLHTLLPGYAAIDRQRDARASRVVRVNLASVGATRPENAPGYNAGQVLLMALPRQRRLEYYKRRA